MKKLLILLLIFACSVKEPVQQPELLGKSTPEAEGISSQAILNFVESAEKEQPDALHSFILVRHGKIVAEGWWNPYNPESPHLLYSLSKSFTSTAIGLAVNEGLITLDDQVISFSPDKVPENPSENLKAMRIRDLLRMTTGHASDSYRRIQGHPNGWTAGFLSLPVEHKPGTIFIYNTGATYMLSAIIQQVTGETLVDFLQPRLFDPMEIKKPFWRTDPDGINLGGTGLFVTTLDIAKFGQLYLQKGNWRGQQILPKAWVEKATSLQTSNGSNPESDWDQGYGYQFWRCRHNVYRGDGAFGQYCIVMPKYDAVLAITSGSPDMQGILNLVWNHLLVAMGPESLKTDEMSFTALNDKLEHLALSTVEGESTTDIAKVVSGKRYVIAENEQQIQAISFNFTSDNKQITFWIGGDAQILQIGFNTMQRGEMNFPIMGKLAVASSGAWTSDTIYRATMYNYESPHAITFDFTFNGDELLIDTEYNVMFGPTKWPQMKGKLE